MTYIGRLFSTLWCWFGEQHSRSINTISSNLLFSGLSWLLSLAVSRCYFATPVMEESEFPQPKRVCSLFSHCIYQRYQPGTARKAIDGARALMRLVPAPGPAGLDDERHRELAMRRAGTFHDLFDEERGRFDLGFRGLEQQLVMHLQQHAGVQLFPGKGRRNAGHGAFDDVGGRALERRGDRLPLGARAARRVGVADPGDEAFAAEDRLDKAGAAGIGLDPLHIGADRRAAGEIGADVG